MWNAKQQQTLGPYRPGGSDAKADEQPYTQEGSGRRGTSAADGDGNHRREAWEDWDEKPGRSAAASPPHVQAYRAGYVCGNGERQRGAQISALRLPPQHPGTDNCKQVCRAVEKESELLIEEQTEKASRQVLESHVGAGVRAVRSLRIECSVNLVEEQQPQRHHDAARQQERRKRLRPAPDPEGLSGAKDRDEHNKLRVQPRQDPQ